MGASPDVFDPSALSLPVAIPQPRKVRPPRPRARERFLKGPIPWPWLAHACHQPGQALAVALAVWFEAGLRKSNRVALSLSGLGAELGVRRDAARRGLAALEEAGLVGVERQAGRKPVVTILPYGE